VLRYNAMLMAYVPPEVKNSYEEKRAKLYHQWVIRDAGVNGEKKGSEASPSPAN
jgi:hypothetical protein